MSTETMTIEQKIEQLARDCQYADTPDEVDYEVDDSVDALIGYKDGLEDLLRTEGAKLERVSAILRELHPPEAGDALEPEGNAWTAEDALDTARSVIARAIAALEEVSAE